MGKFRSKLKRHEKGKSWARGHSSTSNPENMKHRTKAKSRFFQPNLSLVPPDISSKKTSALTMDAVFKHDARQSFAIGKDEPTVNDLANKLELASMDEDEGMSESQIGCTFKTYQTFSTQYSSCTNVSFRKLLNGFRVDSELHKEMLAMLTALTEIIKERAGKESSTEYFILLRNTIDCSKQQSSIVAAVYLLSMVIKTVSTAVLRKEFSKTADMLMELLENSLNSSNQCVIRNVIGCMSVLLRAQDYESWSYSSTTRYFDALLTFTIHTKPKIRKAAQHAVIAILNGSSFMRCSKTDVENNSGEVEDHIQLETEAKVEFNTKIQHPAGTRLFKFCQMQFKPDVIANSQAVVLHTFGLLNDTVGCLKSQEIKTTCESILSIMTAPNVLIRTKGFETFYSLFLLRSANLNSELCGKLISAIYDLRPDDSSTRELIAWFTVLKQGYVHFFTVGRDLCMKSLPRFVSAALTCTYQKYFVNDILTCTTNILKELFNDCIGPVCASQETTEQYKNVLIKIVDIVYEGLDNYAPIDEFTKYIIRICSFLLEAIGKYLNFAVEKILQKLGSQYDTQSSFRLQIEHAILAAIRVQGPELVWKAVPLTNSSGDVLLEKSWLLPLLREGVSESSIEFFAANILKLAAECNKKWDHYKQQNKMSLSHTYELLCCQLWGLFPGFCRNPVDIEKFGMVAKVLGMAIQDNPDFRAPILDGFKELLNEPTEDTKIVLSKYAKNYIPRFITVYNTKPNGTYEAEIRKLTLEVIKKYLTITPEEVLSELFEMLSEQLKKNTSGTFAHDAVFDIANVSIVYQSEKDLHAFFQGFIVPIIKQSKSKVVAKDDQKLGKQQRKSYELLKEIMSNENAGCKKFCKQNMKAIENLLLSSFETSFPTSHAARLKCFKILIDVKENVSIKSTFVVKVIPEIILNFKTFSTKQESIAFDLIITIAELYQKGDKLNDLIDTILAGFGGDASLIVNTILMLRAIVQHLTGNLTINTLKFVLEQVIVYLVQKNRAQSEAVLLFLMTFIKVLPIPLVANHLELLMKSLSAMVPDTKRYCRLQIGYVLRRLCKKFGAAECVKFVPGNDEITHKRLKKIRKDLNREGRKKLDHDKNNDADDESDDDILGNLEKKSATIDDILNDSDSDSVLADDEEMNDVRQTSRKKKSKNKEMFLQEQPEDILDLADMKSMGNVITNKANQTNSPLTMADIKKKKKKEKDSNHGFKLAEDGRLIITDKACNSDGEESSDVDEEMETDQTTGAKRTLDDDDSSDDENMPPKLRKRLAADKKSLTSNKSATAVQYVAGGKGIHRPLKGSVKSGYSGISRKSTVTAKSVGSEYSSKKAKGDMKKKGKLDPYAYIPLSRNILNKRKRAKHAGQFKSIVKGARKGAKKGSAKVAKGRVRKSYKNK